MNTIEECGHILEPEEKKPKTKKISKTKNLLAEGLAEMGKKKKKSTKTKKSHREEQPEESQEQNNTNLLPTADAPKKKKRKSKRDQDEPIAPIVVDEPEPIIEEQQEEECRHVIEEAPPNEEYDDNESQIKVIPEQNQNSNQENDETPEQPINEETEQKEPEVLQQITEEIQATNDSEALLPPKPKKKRISKRKSKKDSTKEKDTNEVKEIVPIANTVEEVEKLTAEKANLVFKNVKSSEYAHTIARVLESLSNLKGNLNVYVYVSDDQQTEAPSINIAQKIRDLLDNIPAVEQEKAYSEIAEEVLVMDSEYVAVLEEETEYDGVIGEYVEDEEYIVDYMGLKTGNVEGYGYINEDNDQEQVEYQYKNDSDNDMVDYTPSYV